MSTLPKPTPATRRRAALLKALAHPTRVLIVEALLGGEQCVCHLHESAGGDVSTVSKHLAVMRKAGLLLAEKRGLNNYYRLACPCLGTFLLCLDDLSPRRPLRKRTLAPSGYATL